MWYGVTGDSFVVDVRDVYNIEGACWYLSKYLSKHMYGKKRKEIEEKGYSRRYMASGKWPRGAQMRRKGTVLKAWVDTGFSYGPPNVELAEWSKDQPLMGQMGTDMAKELLDAKLTAKRMKQYGRFKSASNVLA